MKKVPSSPPACPSASLASSVISSEPSDHGPRHSPLPHGLRIWKSCVPWYSVTASSEYAWPLTRPHPRTASPAVPSPTVSVPIPSASSPALRSSSLPVLTPSTSPRISCALMYSKSASWSGRSPSSPSLISSAGTHRPPVSTSSAHEVKPPSMFSQQPTALAIAFEHRRQHRLVGVSDVSDVCPSSSCVTAT